jgi:hypothetical protein
MTMPPGPHATVMLPSRLENFKAAIARQIGLSGAVFGAGNTPRGRMVCMLMGLCFISHFNRVAISVAANERLMPQFGISPERMGTVYSAFLLGFTLSLAEWNHDEQA